MTTSTRYTHFLQRISEARGCNLYYTLSASLGGRSSSSHDERARSPCILRGPVDPPSPPSIELSLIDRRRTGGRSRSSCRGVATGKARNPYHSSLIRSPLFPFKFRRGASLRWDRPSTPNSKAGPKARTLRRRGCSPPPAPTSPTPGALPRDGIPNNMPSTSRGEMKDPRRQLPRRNGTRRRIRRRSSPADPIEAQWDGGRSTEFGAAGEAWRKCGVTLGR